MLTDREWFASDTYNITTGDEDGMKARIPHKTPPPCTNAGVAVMHINCPWSQPFLVGVAFLHMSPESTFFLLA